MGQNTTAVLQKIGQWTPNWSDFNDRRTNGIMTQAGVIALPINRGSIRGFPIGRQAVLAWWGCLT